MSENETPPDPVAAHKSSIHHKAILMAGELCGCFYCLEIFPPMSILSWTDKSMPDDRHTALCPFCGIDSVIGSESGYPLTKEFLEAMRAHWFGGGHA